MIAASTRLNGFSPAVALADTDLVYVDQNGEAKATVAQFRTALSSNRSVETFVAGTDFTPGSTASLSLVGSYGSVNNIDVYCDGVPQLDCTLSGQTLTFNPSIPAGIQQVVVKGGTSRTIGVPADQSVTDTKVSPGSKLYNRINGFFSVLDFGAKGDGVANDLPAFNDAAASWGGPVLVPPNRQYNLSGGINFQNCFGLWDSQSSGVSPSTTMQISRNVSSVGTTATQNGGFIVYNTVNAGVQHHEYGMFSVLNNYTTDIATENVGFYSQANSKGISAAPLWAGVFEISNIRPEDPTHPTTGEATLAGIELDVWNHFPFNPTVKKLGIVCITRGGGEANEAFAARGPDVPNPPGNGMDSGYWRTGYWIAPGALNPTQGTGLLIDSDHSAGITIDGKSSNFGINLAGAAGSSVGLYVGTNYSTPIIIPPNKKIVMGDIGSIYGISYSTSKTALVLDAPVLGLNDHTTYTSASAGAIGAPPGSIAGYIGVNINGTLFKVPYYNA